MASDARERMVRSAAYLFRERGFSGTAFSDVIAHSGAPRGSIYHHFPGGKIQLAEEAVRYAGDFLGAGVRAATRDDDPVAAVRAFLGWWRRVLVKSDFRAGCPIVAVTVESQLGLGHGAAADAFQRWQDALTAGLVSAGAAPARAARARHARRRRRRGRHHPVPGPPLAAAARRRDRRAGGPDRRRLRDELTRGTMIRMAPDMTPDELLTTTRTVRKRLDLTRPVPPAGPRVPGDRASGAERQQPAALALDRRHRPGAYARRVGEVYAAGRARLPRRRRGSAAGCSPTTRTARGSSGGSGDSAAYLAEHIGRGAGAGHPLPARRGPPEGNQAGVWGSLLPAVWNYMLAARARGLGTAWTSLHLVARARGRRAARPARTTYARARWCRRRTTPARPSARPHASRWRRVLHLDGW